MRGESRGSRAGHGSRRDLRCPGAIRELASIVELEHYVANGGGADRESPALRGDSFMSRGGGLEGRPSARPFVDGPAHGGVRSL